MCLTRQLALCIVRGGNDIGLVVIDLPEELNPHECAVEVSMESAGEVADIRPDLGEGVDGFV